MRHWLTHTLSNAKPSKEDTLMSINFLAKILNCLSWDSGEETAEVLYEAFCLWVGAEKKLFPILRVFFFYHEKCYQLYFTCDKICSCHFHPNPAGGDATREKTALPGVGELGRVPAGGWLSSLFLSVVCGIVFSAGMFLRTNTSNSLEICVCLCCVWWFPGERKELTPKSKAVVDLHAQSRHRVCSLPTNVEITVKEWCSGIAPLWHLSFHDSQTFPFPFFPCLWLILLFP